MGREEEGAAPVPFPGRDAVRPRLEAPEIAPKGRTPSPDQRGQSETKGNKVKN